jgi:hypothetical protein
MTGPLYDPHPGYLERFQDTNHRLWNDLSVPEWKQIQDHVSTGDFAESAADWLMIGRAGGFCSGCQLFIDTTDPYRLFHFDV